MVPALFDEGALVRNGVLKLVRALGELKIPPAVQALLTSRIDRLPSREKLAIPAESKNEHRRHPRAEHVHTFDRAESGISAKAFLRQPSSRFADC